MRTHNSAWNGLIKTSYLGSFTNKREQRTNEFNALVVGTLVYEEGMKNGFFEYHMIQPIEYKFEDLFKFVQVEVEEEFLNRRELIKSYIAMNGLEKNTQEIIDGMNKSSSKVALYETEISQNIFDHRKILHHDSSALLEFGLDYVDRWIMYNELFQERK